MHSIYVIDMFINLSGHVASYDIVVVGQHVIR